MVFVKTARYSRPFSVRFAFRIVSVVEVFPASVESLVQGPPLLDSCHCTVGTCAPVAFTVNVAASFTLTVTGFGCISTLGGAVPAVTVSVAGAVVALPTLLLKTARYSRPLSATVVFATVSTSDLLPESVVSLLQLLPKFVETCHCTLGLGLPEAEAVNVALSPSFVPSLAGSAVTSGLNSTVNVAAPLATVPTGFVNEARYWL